MSVGDERPKVAYVETIEEWKLIGIEGRAKVLTAWRAFDPGERFVESYFYSEKDAKSVPGRRVEAATLVEITKDDGSVVHILVQFGIEAVH